MSGIYIPGMEMPKSCGKCLDVGWHYVFECVLDDVECGERRTDCPLIPVQPHGRLIDADALYEKFLLLESEAMSALQTTSIGSVDGIKW